MRDIFVDTKNKNSKGKFVAFTLKKPAFIITQLLTLYLYYANKNITRKKLCNKKPGSVSLRIYPADFADLRRSVLLIYVDPCHLRAYSFLKLRHD